MGNINFHTQEILLKVVYYGPGLGGKTTALQYLHTTIPVESRSPIVTLDTQTDRTIHFDFLPIALTKLQGFDVRLQLYTVPGQVFYDATRELVLRGADGVVFVADSQAERMEGNVISLEDLRVNLDEQGTSIDEVPLIFQYNKRDLPDIATIADLQEKLNGGGAPFFPTIATKGVGLTDALQTISKLAIRYYVDRNRIRS